MPPDLSDEDITDLAKLIKRAIDASRYPFSPEVRRWKELLAKLDRGYLGCGLFGRRQTPRPVPSDPALSPRVTIPHSVPGDGGLTYFIPRVVRSRRSRSRDF
jgi:hypothetical protein